MVIRHLSGMHVAMAQRKIQAFFSCQEQDQHIHDCREVMAISEISSSVPEDASIYNAEYFMESTSGESTSVNEPSTRSSACTCSCSENFEVTHETDKLDLVHMANQFVCANSRRLNYFGKF